MSDQCHHTPERHGQGGSSGSFYCCSICRRDWAAPCPAGRWRFMSGQSMSVLRRRRSGRHGDWAEAGLAIFEGSHWHTRRAVKEKTLPKAEPPKYGVICLNFSDRLTCKIGGDPWGIRHPIPRRLDALPQRSAPTAHFASSTSAWKSRIYRLSDDISAIVPRCAQRQNNSDGF